MRIQKTKILLFFVVLFAFSSAFSQTQFEMNQEACDEYKKADDKLNQVYQQILREYKKDTFFIQKLKEAQLAWLKFRDAHIESLYPLKPNASPLSEYGSVYPMCVCIALKEITEKRIEELKKWIDRVEEGEVCSGSIEIKSSDIKVEQHFRTGVNSKSRPRRPQKRKFER